MSKKETTLTVYTQTGCGPCVDFKKWLNEKNIPFIEKDVQQNKAFFDEFKEKGFQYTPTSILEHDGETYEIQGANKVKIERLLSF